jgi:ABC-type sugar transport system ATPase subunit
MANVKLRNIRKSFGAVDVIKGVDIEIEDGEFVVFVGPSGCGKSTLLRMIAGLEDITSGTLEIDGEVVNDKPAEAPRHRDGVPVLRDLSAHDGARKCCFRPHDQRPLEGGEGQRSPKPRV